MATGPPTTADKAAGVLLGLVAGDRIGGPTQMALRVAESLHTHGGFDAADIGARYLAWWRAGAFDTGPTADGVLRLVDAGVTFAEAAERADAAANGLTAGCNPMHRIPPLGAFAFVPNHELVRCAEAEAQLTHAHPLAADASAACAILCRGLVFGLGWSGACRAAARQRKPSIAAALCEREGGALDAGGFAPATLAAAVHFIDTHDSFGEALTAAVAFAGPANYAPVLVGAIGGARWGATAVDAAHLAHAESVVEHARLLGAGAAASWARRPVAP